MPTRNSPPLPQPSRNIDVLSSSPPLPLSQRSFLEVYRPGHPAAQLPSGGENDRASPWWQDPKPLSLPVEMGLGPEWELPYQTQLSNWRKRSLRYQGNQELSHGMIPGQTWLLHIPIPEGEMSPDNKPPQARSRLLLVCLPPLVLIQEGDRIGCSDPRNLARRPNSSRMPSRVLTVCRNPYLLADHELERLAWAAMEDRSALVGEKLPEDQPAPVEQKPPSPKRTR